MNDDEKTALIATQNDRFRANFNMPFFGMRGVPGQFVCTHGISTLPPETQLAVWQAVAGFNDFNQYNDSHGEHDFGAVTIPEVPEKIFWKIDYYSDHSCTFGSEEPSDPARCYRVLTIMLASEY